MRSVTTFLLGVIPTFFNPLDVSFKKLWLVWMLKDHLAFANEIGDNISSWCHPNLLQSS